MPVPPPHIVKQQALQSYAERFGLKPLVETGTFRGHMIEAMIDVFERIYSIELSEQLYRRAKGKFHSAGNVELICGDSGVELGNLIGKLDQPTLFWLDGHYSGETTAQGARDTPVCDELDAILNARGLGHVIIIDDARCFGADPAYPNLRQLTEIVRSKRSDLHIAVTDDMIRITPNR